MITPLTIVFALTCLVESGLGAPVMGTCKNMHGTPCSHTGTSATYSETIANDVRRIRAGGCPNNNPHTPCIGSNPNEGGVQNWEFDIPATPKLLAADYATSMAQGLKLERVGGLVGIAINGIEIRGCWGGNKYPTCVDYASSATNVEGNTFDYCGGHGNPYHYHQVPSCLVQQIGPRADGSSPHVGWAADGFPIYGNKGPGGVLIKRCGQAGAHAKYCADQCGGYYGTDWNDQFVYRYFMMGPDSDFQTNPVTPTATAEYFPMVMWCLVGCGSVTATGTDRNPSIGGQMKACTASSAAGTVAGYVPTPTTGVTAAYVAVVGNGTAATSGAGTAGGGSGVDSTATSGGSSTAGSNATAGTATAGGTSGAAATGQTTLDSTSTSTSGVIGIAAPTAIIALLAANLFAT